LIYIPSSNLKPGMILARDIDFGVSFFPLLTKGQVLNEALIIKIRTKGIKGAYVESKATGDLVIKEMVDKKVINKTLKDIKSIFEKYSQTSFISPEHLKQISEMARVLVNSVLSNDDIIINLSSLKDYDSYTYTHSLSVALLCITIGIKMGYRESTLVDLACCGLLHDLGKMAIPLSVLNKPACLTEEEFALMKEHPGIAYNHLLDKHIFTSAVLRGIESHHEKYDGTGYPKGLKGERIPLYGRVLAVADVYDALTSDRPYRSARFAHEAIEYMMGCANTHFDLEILQAFLKSVAAYPVGMVIVLSNGWKAVVVKNHSENILRPVVRPLTRSGKLLKDIDLLHDFQYCNITITGRCEDETSESLADYAKDQDADRQEE
jgi:HD-GYP domain-containing protein (c-di-GMP phosphodiesterase class II)